MRSLKLEEYMEDISKITRDVITSLTEKHVSDAKGFDVDYGGNIERFYTTGHCGDLAYMLYTYLNKIGHKCNIAIITEDDGDDPCPGLTTHVGVLFNNKFYDIIYQDGIEMTETNTNELLDRYGGIRILVHEKPGFGFDPENYNGKGKYAGFNEIVDITLRERSKK